MQFYIVCLDLNVPIHIMISIQMRAKLWFHLYALIYWSSSVYRDKNDFFKNLLLLWHYHDNLRISLIFWNVGGHIFVHISWFQRSCSNVFHQIRRQSLLMRNLSIFVILESIRYLSEDFKTYQETVLLDWWANLEQLCDKFAVCLSWLFNFLHLNYAACNAIH